MDIELLRRIAEALERIAPARAADVCGDARVWHWMDGGLRPVEAFAPLPLTLLTGIDAQKSALLQNTTRLAHGHAAHDVLLWGARGAGKSALVKSVVGELQAGGHSLTLVEASTADLHELPHIFSIARRWDRPTVIFMDDLAFEGGSGGARWLRSLLEGGASARPAHVRLYVTSNRRHIVARDMAEQDSAINVRDVVDDQLALADRFGLSLGFHVCDQESWLAMVRAYAKHLGVPFNQADALTWATQRGARSGRMAWHYAVELAGRHGVAMGGNFRG